MFRPRPATVNLRASLSKATEPGCSTVPTSPLFAKIPIDGEGFGEGSLCARTASPDDTNAVRQSSEAIKIAPTIKNATTPNAIAKRNMAVSSTHGPVLPGGLVHEAYSLSRLTKHFFAVPIFHE